MLPGSFITGRRQAQLANTIWNKVRPGRNLFAGPELSYISEDLPWVSRRIIECAGWIIGNRESRIRPLNTQLGTDYGDTEIADVEHFYCGAILGTIGGPVGGPIVGFWVSALWDLALSPLSKVLDGDGWRRAMAHDLRQFGGPDLQGVAFGSIYKVTGYWDMSVR